MKKLISKGDTNAKTKKNFLETHILYMSPYNQNSKGINICPNATEPCIIGCLNTSGMGKWNITQEARRRRTEMYLNNRQEFCEQIAKELSLLNKKATKKGGKIAVRLNGTSDLDFIAIINNRLGIDILNDFPNLEFYDYTKVIGKVLKYKGTRYTLTFSRTESNDDDCFRALLSGTNVAVVFDDKKPMPNTYLGSRVVNGDEADDLMLNLEGVVLGLKAKGKAKKDTFGFVVR